MVGTPLMTGHRVAHIARSRPSLRSDFGRGNKVNHHDLLLTCEVGTHLCLFNAGLAWALAFLLKNTVQDRRRTPRAAGAAAWVWGTRQWSRRTARARRASPPRTIQHHPPSCASTPSPRRPRARLTPAGQVGCGLRTPRRVALVQGLSNLPLTSQSVSLSRAPPAPTVSPPHSRAARARGAGPGRGGRHQKSHFSHYIKCTVI